MNPNHSVAGRKRFGLIGCILWIRVLSQGAPIEVGDRKQLFIDQRFVASSQGIQLRMNPAQKLGLIQDEHGQPSSESGHTSRVIEDQGRIRLYVGAGDLYVHYNAATIYPWAQDVYLMFTAPFRHFSPQRNPALKPPHGHWEDFGLLEVQLACSRDGIRWQRPSREPYFPTGLADEWDRWYAVMAPGMVRRGNYLYQYYCSSGRTHDSAILRPEYEKTAARMGGIGVVRQRLDGFVSADADHRGGWLETPEIQFTGNRLRLNIDTGALGTAFVEFRAADGRALPGFEWAACEEIGGNFIDQLVYWKGNPDVSALQGRTVRLRFQLTRAKLFGFQFTKE